MDGIHAMQWAREISKLPKGDFTLCFFPYSRSQGMAGESMVVKEHCRYRTQLPQDRFAVDSENYFLFEDGMVSQGCATAYSSGIWAFRKTDINYTR